MKKQSIVVSGINQLIYALTISSFDSAEITYIAVEKGTKLNDRELEIEIGLVRKILKVFDRELYKWHVISIELSYDNYKKSYVWSGQVDITKYTNVLCSQSIFKLFKFNKKKVPTFTFLAEGYSFVAGLKTFSNLYYSRFLIFTIAKYIYWFICFKQKPPHIYLPVSYNDHLIKAITEKKLNFRTHTNSTYVSFSDYKQSISKIQKVLLTKNDLNIKYLHLSNKLVGCEAYFDWVNTLLNLVPSNTKIHFKMHPSDFRSFDFLRKKRVVLLKGEKARLPAELFLNSDVKLIGWFSTTILMVAPENVIFSPPPNEDYMAFSKKLFENLEVLGYCSNA